MEVVKGVVVVVLVVVGGWVGRGGYQCECILSNDICGGPPQRSAPGDLACVDAHVDAHVRRLTSILPVILRHTLLQFLAQLL